MGRGGELKCLANVNQQYFCNSKPFPGRSSHLQRIGPINYHFRPFFVVVVVDFDELGGLAELFDHSIWWIYVRCSYFTFF